MLLHADFGASSGAIGVNPRGETVLVHTLHERSCKVERKKGQRYSQEFRRKAVQRMNACNNVLGLPRELGIHRRLLYNWRDRFDQSNPGQAPFPRIPSPQGNYQTEANPREQDDGSGFFQTCLAKSRGSFEVTDGVVGVGLRAPKGSAPRRQASWGHIGDKKKGKWGWSWPASAR